MSLPRIAFVAAVLSLLPRAGFAAARVPAYKGAITVEASTGRVLFADNADEVSPPASMTKLMTFAILEDEIHAGRLTIHTPITITAADAKVAGLRDSTNVALRAKEVFPVEELIYAMMIPSANDAAYAVADAVGHGSVPAFVERMNAKARELGMNHTTFRTPNGLPVRSHRVADGDLTTPRDFSLLCRYLLLNTDILKYTSVRTRPFGASQRMQPYQMTNHNHLLGRIAGVDGLKTGFTNGAGFCLSTTAQRGGRRIIVVLMGSPDTRSRDQKVAELIDRGFTTLPVFGAEGPLHAAPAAPAAAPAAVPAAPGGFSAPSRPAPAGALPAIQFTPPR